MSIRSRCTAAVRAGIDSDTAYGAVTPPIVLSSNFSFAGFNEKRKYDYTRSGNPTRDLLAEALAELEGGAGAVITATGMGAITLLLHALLKPGDRLVVPHDGYGGSWRLFNALAKKGAFELITATSPIRARWPSAGAAPELVWIETPSNPLLRITDLRFVIEAAHRPARWPWSTTPSCRRRCSSRSPSAPTSSCIRPPSTSTATATWSAARWSRRTPSSTSSWCGGRMRWA
jgi:cystathionine gamma-synthase